MQATKMDARGSESLNVQTFMIVWDINLRITNKVDRIDIFSPLFSLNPNKYENSNLFRLYRFEDKLKIESNFSSLKQLKQCTTYMIDSSTSTLLDVYKGFKDFTWNQHDWSEKLRFVFEVEMQYHTPALQSTIWKHCITAVKPAINMNFEILNPEAEKTTHTVVNNRGVSCVLKRYTIDFKYVVDIKPEKPSENWDLLTVMLRKLSNNDWEWYYIHTTRNGKRIWDERSFPTCQPTIVLEIHELITSLAVLSDLEMDNITSVIKPNLPSSNLIATTAAPTREAELQLNLAVGSREWQHLLNLSSNLKEYFVSAKFCDITIHVQDIQIRAHKTTLATGSSIWHNLFFEYEQLDTIHIVDFDYETTKDLIEFMYTGTVKKVTNQLLIAAVKFDVIGLKELCEEKLIETLEMKNVAKLLVLADRYKARSLYDKTVDFIGDHFKEFMELDEAKGMFMMDPMLAFKLFTRISRK